MTFCTDCQKPIPTEFCWDGRMNCQFKPPRYMTLTDLWFYVKALEQRVIDNLQ